jgi:UDP-N-acetylmuramoyl-tripeptide--D-alanyl-D-alanine ligase
MFTVDDILKGTQGRLSSGPGYGRIRSVSSDSRTVKPQDAFIAIKGDRFDGHDFVSQAVKCGARLIITERDAAVKGSGVSVVRVKDTLKALGDLAGYWRRKSGIPVIAVTGSNGKTTTKDMIAWVLGSRFKILKNPGTHNNHIGLPQTLLGLDKTYRLAVLEIGTNHFGEVGCLADICKPDMAVITNIGPSHLEFLKNLEGVYREKRTLLGKLSGPRIAVLNADDNFLCRDLRAGAKKGFRLGIGIEKRCDYMAGSIYSCTKGTQFTVNEKYKFTLNTPGSYNIYNALAAVAAGRIFGLGYKDISARLKTFAFPKSRLNLIKVRGITFIDDTYNSNPLSFSVALETLRKIDSGGRKILVMGDMLELGAGSKEFHAQAVRAALEFCDCLVTVGNLSRDACSGFRGSKKIFSCGDSAQARELLFRKIKFSDRDVVLIKGSRAMALEGVFKV